MLVLGLLAAGCAETPAPQAVAGPAVGVTDSHIPPYARWPYQPFSREAAVQIAYREWRAFGQPVVYPNTELPFDREREEGMWQRVGDYWWQGLPIGTLEGGFTGVHDANGRVFSEREDGNFAWSAAFIDYVMRKAGAGPRFPYSPTHSDYINAARQGGGGRIVISAERPDNYAPQRGDLICMWRGRRKITYDDLPTDRFPGHCDIVVAVSSGSLDVIGGNVDNSVSMKHIPVTTSGLLANPDGTVVDPDYPWFAVLRVQYDR
jgi:Uncharacterized protein conserved in bacteria (DUF2272)